MTEEAKTGAGKTLRYPRDLKIDTDTDYIEFEFYSYRAPFKKYGSYNLPDGTTQGGRSNPQGGKDNNRNRGLNNTWRDALAKYNQLGDKGENEANWAGNFGKKARSFAGTIQLYMPQDVSTSFASQWGGKEFSNMTAGVLSGLKDPAQALTDGARTLPAGMVGLKTDTIRWLLNQANQTVTQNDVMAGTSNAILNPNVELMFGGPQLRNIGFKWKMSARSNNEAQDINSICKIFKYQSLATYDGHKDDGDEITNISGWGNFIKIPDLVRMRLMMGGKPHPYLSQYKALALTNVDINYTPDGSYTTYEGGMPTSVELSIQMVETKIVYKDDIWKQDKEWSY